MAGNLCVQYLIHVPPHISEYRGQGIVSPCVRGDGAPCDHGEHGAMSHKGDTCSNTTLEPASVLLVVLTLNREQMSAT